MAPRSACRRRRFTRLQIVDSATRVRGAHTIRLGGEIHRVDAEFRLGVFQQGRIELVQDFPDSDHNGDGRVDDDDLLFAVTLRSGKPDEALIQPEKRSSAWPSASSSSRRETAWARRRVRAVVM